MGILSLSNDFLSVMEHEPEELGDLSTASPLICKTIDLLLGKCGFSAKQRSAMRILGDDFSDGILTIEFAMPEDLEHYQQITDFLNGVAFSRDLVNGFSAYEWIEDEIRYNEALDEEEDFGDEPDVYENCPQRYNNTLITYDVECCVLSGNISDVISALENYLSCEDIENIEEYDNPRNFGKLQSMTQQCFNRVWGCKPH